MKEPVIVTTSWDDGDPLDLRVAELLRQRGLPGTFYIPITGYLGRRTIKATDMRNLVQAGFEIGGHSYSHRSLTGLERFELQREVCYCRTTLEDTLGLPVTMFCYPKGRYDQATVDFLEACGYIGARTTRMLRTDAGENRYEIPTTVQAFPHSPITYLRNAAKDGNWSCIFRFAYKTCTSSSWVELGMHTFDRVFKNGGVWHLYGHSWEVNDYRLWDGLRMLLDYVASRAGVKYLTNGQLAVHAHGNPFSEPAEIAA